MLAKKQKAKLTHFSSEDSQNTDHSMNSSLEIAESNAQNNHANKFNQLRETMNQLFLANPELAEEIKFERYLETGAGEADNESPRNTHLPSASPLKKPSAGSHDHIPSGNEEGGTNMASAKFWGAISKEMTKPQKNSKMPAINQINHILNIYKAKFEKPEQTEISMSPTKSVLKKPKSEFRIQSAKVGGDKQLLSARKDGKKGDQNNSSLQEEGEDGVNYYSFRKKMHLKLKQKRIERELEEQKRKKELEAEKEKAAKEREQKLMMYTLAELDQELKKGGIHSMKPDVEDRPGEASTRHGTKLIKPRGSGSRKNSLQGKGGNIFDRLTKDMNKNATTEEEEDNHPKRTFTSPFAESLYNDMKAFGDPEAFKKIAQARIMNYKKEFKEKLSKQKQLPLEGLRFSKDKSRYLNMFVPDFEKAAAFPNKESIFSTKEIQKDSEEWKENPDYDILAKFSKIRNGNILEFWQESKDLNQ